MALKTDDEDQKRGVPRAAPGLVGPGAQGAQSAPTPGSVAAIAARSFGDGATTQTPLTKLTQNLSTQARGLGNAAASLTVGPIDDIGRAGLALVTGNDPTTRPGGALASTNRFLAGAKQAERDLLGGQTAGQAIQHAGASITGTQPLGGAVPATPVPAPAPTAAPASGIPLLSAQNPIPVAPASQAPAQPPAPESGVYRSRQNGVLTFSDQPSQGAQPYAPGGAQPQGLTRFVGGQPVAGPTVVGGDTAQLQRFIQQSGQDHRVARAQQAQDFASSTAAENQIAARNSLENAARNARINAGSLRLTPGGRTQRQLLAESADFANRAAGIQAQPPDKDFITSPQDEAEIDTKRLTADSQAREAASRAQLQAAQTEGQRIGNEGATREQSLLAKFASQPRDQQQTTISELLLRRGQNPTTSDYDARTLGGGQDEQMRPLPQSLAIINKKDGTYQIVGQGGTGASASGAPANVAEGTVATDAKGNKRVFKNGQWQEQ